MAKHCIGIDLGGTYVKFCLLDSEKQASETLEMPTPGTPDELIRQMVNGTRALMEEHHLSDGDIVAVGVGSPGPLDFRTGSTLSLANLHFLDHLPIREMVSDGLGFPTVLEKDANTAAYGEYIFRSDESISDMVLLTLGTGLGSGIIIGGKILHGAHGVGGEIGHMIVEPGGERCGCGQRGCLERYCSATYVAQHARTRLEAENHTGPLAASLKQKGNIDAKDILHAARTGDRLAGEVWDRAAYYLAVGCINICRALDPDAILLGGGMTRAGEGLTAPLMEHFRELDWSSAKMQTKIEIATLGNDAGAIGAAGVAWSEFG